jgi:S1-C subfamily serine protease
MVLELIIQIADKICNEPKLICTKTKQPESQKVSFKVTLGIMPDYTFEGKGLRVDNVNNGKPAEKAGLKAGDIIMQIGSIKIDNIYDYMKAFGQFKKGESTTIDFLREGKMQQVSLTF